MRTHAAILAFFAVAAVAMTWPLAPNLDVAVAHPGDPFINAWILDWEFYALTHRDAALFHGNIFHPLPYTIAFSENILGIFVVMLPLFLAGAPILVIYNVAVLAGYALSGYAMALLGRHLTGSTAAGIVAGIFFTFVPWRFSHLTHLQHLWTLWLPLMLLALLRLRDKPTPLRAALFAGAFFMNGLTNLHWLAFGSVAIACIALFLPVRRQAIVAMFAGSVALLPMLIPYWKAGKLYGLRGDAGETLQYSGTLQGWTVASLHNRLYGPLTNDGSTNPEHWAFPGILVLLLAIAGVVAAAKRERNIALFFIVLGFLGSLGLHTFFGRFLFEVVPLFRGIRAPARWAMIVYLGLAILAAYGVPRRKWAAAVIAALMLFELRAAPIRWYLTTGAVPAVYQSLAKQDLEGGVLELPADHLHNYEYMYFATVHHKRLVNGVSGFLPPGYDDVNAMRKHAELVLTHDQPPPVVLEHPVHWEQITGALEITGHADTPLRSATLYFDNRRSRLEASVSGNRFSARFPSRPDRIRADTDLQVDVTDATGRTRRTRQVWLRWRNPGETLQESQLPQTAELGPYLVHPRHADDFPRTRPAP
ncbi:MAG TPA: hypothetical protein VF266_04785 [Thermoanaerobaculia bacterium]